VAHPGSMEAAAKAADPIAADERKCLLFIYFLLNYLFADMAKIQLKTENITSFG
jgi:hypothetical protein